MVAAYTREKIHQAKQMLRNEAWTMVDSRKKQAVEGLDSIAKALRSSGQQLQDKPGLAKYTGEAAGKIEYFSHYLNEKNVDELLRDTEEFARRRPAIVIAGAFLTGLLLARLAKSGTA